MRESMSVSSGWVQIRALDELRRLLDQVQNRWSYWHYPWPWHDSNYCPDNYSCPHGPYFWYQRWSILLVIPTYMADQLDNLYFVYLMPFKPMQLCKIAPNWTENYCTWWIWKEGTRWISLMWAPPTSFYEVDSLACFQFLGQCVVRGWNFSIDTRYSKFRSPVVVGSQIGASKMLDFYITWRWEHPVLNLAGVMSCNLQLTS